MTTHRRDVRVLSFAPSANNCVLVGDEKFVLVRPEGEAPLLLRSRCPHRGGPMHLGRLEDHGQAVVCPMHELKYPLAKLALAALPAICRSDQVTAVIAVPEPQTPVSVHALHSLLP